MHGCRVLVKDFNQLKETNSNLLYLLREKEDRDEEASVSYAITDIYPQVFSWLELLDINVWIILGLMIAVAGFTMVSGLLIIIIERTSMIGTLKALGAKNRSIRHTFLWFAVFIIVKGMVIGNVIGLGICFLQQQFGLVKLDAETYYVDVVPVEVNIPLILLLNLATLLISVVVLIAPSFLITHIQPAKAIKYE